MSEWIKRGDKNKYPATGEEYLVKSTYHGRVIAMFFGEETWRMWLYSDPDNTKDAHIEIRLYLNDVTHWQELPADPED